MKTKASNTKIQTTLRLPRGLYEQAVHLLEASASKAGSLNDFIVQALQAYVGLWRRRQIDAEFAAMASDANYQKRAERISEEFATSDWEALDIADRERSGARHATR